MRQATTQEELEHRAYFVKVTFDNPENPKKRPEKRLGPYRQPDVEQQALAEAASRFKYGTNFRVLEIDSEWVEGVRFDKEWPKDEIFFWDWKQLPGEKFFEKLDQQLVPFGAEVVMLEDNGAYIWFVGPGLNS